MAAARYLVIRPHVRLYWYPEPAGNMALVAGSGAAFGVCASLTPDDVAQVRLLLLTGEFGKPPHRVARWLVEHDYADLCARPPSAGGPLDWDSEWSRQLSSYGVFAGIDRAGEVHAAVRASRVLVVGVGGIGCNAVQQLLGIGVRRFTLIDPDVVELSNLNRQVLFTRQDLNHLKVEAAAAAIRRRAPGGEVAPVATDFLEWSPSPGTLRGFDLAVLSADTPYARIRRHATQLLYSAGVPYLFAAYRGDIAQLGPVVLSRADGCGSCLLFMLGIDRDLSPVAEAESRFIPPSSASINAMLAGMLVDRWVRWIGGVEGGTGIWELDIGRWSTVFQPLRRLSACPVCGRGAGGVSESPE